MWARGPARGGGAEGRGPRAGARGRPALTMSAGRVRGAVERRRLPVRPCRFDAAARPLPPPPGSEHPGQRRRPRPRAAPRQSARGSPAIAKYGCAAAGREGGAERTTPLARGGRGARRHQLQRGGERGGQSEPGGGHGGGACGGRARSSGPALSRSRSL